jgi:hypothetical protein
MRAIAMIWPSRVKAESAAGFFCARSTNLVMVASESLRIRWRQLRRLDPSESAGHQLTVDLWAAQSESARMGTG